MNIHAQCHLCDGEHEDALHKVKLGLRKWFKGQVTMSIRKVKQGAARTKPRPEPDAVVRDKRILSGL